jgi:hypothetical protein
MAGKWGGNKPMFELIRNYEIQMALLAIKLDGKRA